MPHKSFRFLAALILTLIPGISARAAFVQGVTIKSSTLGYTALSSTADRRPSTNTVINTGLFGDIHTYSPGGTMWLSAQNGLAHTNFVVFDLGAVHTVNAMKVWNYNEAAQTARGIKTASISYSLDGVNFTTNIADPGVATNYTFNIAPGAFTNFAQIIPNLGFSARYVRLDVVTNWATAQNYIGFSKVRFIDNSVAPTVVSANENYGSNQVTVFFSQSVDPASATNLANYSFQSSGPVPAILSLKMGEFNDRVVLKTSPLTNSSYSLNIANVSDLELTAAVASTNIALQPEMILWLRADNGVVADGSGNVSQWLDQSGYHHNAQQGTNPVNQTAISTPILTPGIVNGQPALAFDGTRGLEVPSSPDLAINGDIAVVIVMAKASSAAADLIARTGGLGSTASNNMPAPFDIQVNASQIATWTWGNPSEGGPTTANATGPLSLNSFYIVSYVVQGGTNVQLYLNGSFNGAKLLPYAPSDDNKPLRLGYRFDNGLKFNGYMAEAMVIRGTITPSDLVAVHNYLGPKYGIPIVSLGINEQPQNVTAQIGKKATFWVNAVGVPPLTYQWKSNNVNIAGATSAIYTTPALSTVPFNGLNYTVTVTSPVGTTNSTAATLTVVPDTSAPTLFSASKVTGNLTNIAVVFSESVSSGTALTPANYSLNGVTVQSASFGSTSNIVILGTTALDPNAAYNLTVQNVQDFFGNTMAAATTPVMPATMSMYLRGDTGVNLDANNLVSQWQDLTTNGNNAQQYIGGGSVLRPQTGVSTINNQPVVTFYSSSSNYLQAASTPSLAITGDMSIYVVANIYDFGAPRQFVGKTSGNLPAPYDYYVRADANNTPFLRGNGSVYAQFSGALPTPGIHAFAVTMTGTNVVEYVDGARTSAGGLSTTIADAGKPLRVGTRDDFNQFMNGDMAEVMIFSSALSTNDQVAVDNYVGQKYFQFNITQQPVDTATNVGATATFSVAANQGSAHLSYQWQENSTNIPGATNATYTTSVLAPSDNGDTFDVLVIIPGLSTNVSGTATLTVNNVPPVVASVGIPIWSLTNVVVLFSEAVDPATASVVGNYALNNGAVVLSAAVGDVPNKVVLTTSVLNRSTAYMLTVQNVKDFYNNTLVTAGSSLGVYPPMTALWLKPDAGISADPSTGLITEWDDQSGNANNFFTSVSPLLVSNTVNNLPVVRFDGTNTYMYANTSPSLAITGDMAVFAVVNFHSFSAAGAGEIVSKTAGAANNIPASYDYYVQSSTDFRFYRGNGTASALFRATTIPSAGVPHILDVNQQGTTVSHRLDGNTNGTGTLSTTLGDGGTEVFLGTRKDSGIHLNGDIAELIIVGSSVSSNDTAALETYLGNRYKLPIGVQSYPRITQQPVSSTNVDQNSTVTVAAAATGSPQVGFQWYDTNNVAVAGQTNANLTLANIQASGAYYLTANNIFGSATSSIVTVTVISGPPQVNLGPANLTLYTGRSYTYSVSAFGSAPLSYQWFEDATLIPNATNSSYSFAVPPGTHTFSVTVSNSLASVPSATVTLVGISAPTTSYAASILNAGPVAYWRLDESSGTLANDYVGGHSGLYTNVQLGLAGFPFDSDTAAGFGSLLASNSFVGEIDNSTNGIANIDFQQPANGNAALSVEAWVNSSAAQIAGAGIVTKGYGNGGEQFDLDMGSPLGFRFFVRDAAGGVHSANSSVVPTVGQWYHLAGVWDGANGAVRLYINGVDTADATNIATGIGLKTAPTTGTAPGSSRVSIGARTSAQTNANYDLQFKGTIDEVAIYNYALSAGQIATQYQAATAPTPQPLTLTNLNGSLRLNWSFGTLQTSTNAHGPYSDITNAAPPYTILPTNAHQFYRVREN